MNKYPFSVLIPAYNRVNFIEETVESALSQLNKDDEIVVVDDGSTDRTREFFETRYKDENRIRYIFKEHTNAPDTRNLAIREAKNPWIVWLGSDDVLMKGILRHYRKGLEEFPDVDVLYGDQEIFGDTQNAEKPAMIFHDYYKKNKQLLSELFVGNKIPDTGVLVRKEIYKIHGDYNLDFPRLHDYELWVRTAPHLNFKHCGRFMCKWRWHGGNMSTGSVKKDMRYESKIVDRILELYSYEEIFPFYKAKDTGPLLARCYLEIGMQYRKVTDYEKAVHYILKSLKVRPMGMAYFEILFLVTMHSRDLPENVKEKIPAEVISKAKKILPKITGEGFLERYRLASLIKAIGDYKNAKQRFFGLMIELERPINSEYSNLLAGVHFHIGEILLNEKEMEVNALCGFFRRCLIIQPNHKKAAQYLAELEKK